MVVGQGNVTFLLSERGFHSTEDNPDLSEKGFQPANEAKGNLDPSHERILQPAAGRVSQPEGGQKSEPKDPKTQSHADQQQRTGHEGEPCVGGNWVYPWLAHLSNLSVDTLFNVCLEVN